MGAAVAFFSFFLRKLLRNLSVRADDRKALSVLTRRRTVLIVAGQEDIGYRAGQHWGAVAC